MEKFALPASFRADICLAGRSLLFLAFWIVQNITWAQVFDPGEILLTSLVTDSFQSQKHVYCQDCPDQFNGSRDYFLYVDIPVDSFSSIPERPLVIGIPPFDPGEDLCNADSCRFSELIRERFGRYGWVTATLDYRKEIPGFSPLFTCNSDPRGFLQAGIRGVHDLRLALDYVRRHQHELKIDPSLIFLYGMGHGAAVSLEAVHLEDQRELETYFFAEAQSGRSASGWDSLDAGNIRGMVLEQAYLPQPAIMDSDHDVPLFLIHNVCNEFFPATFGNIYNCCQLPMIAGSHSISCRQDEIGSPYQVHLTNGEASGQLADSLNNMTRQWMRSLAMGDTAISSFHSYDLGFCDIELPDPGLPSSCLPVYSNYCDLEDPIFKSDLSANWCMPLPRVEFDIPYDTVINFQGLTETLEFDFFKPRDLAPTEKRPLIIFLYQGGFILGSKEDMASFAAGLTVAGFVTAAINYRLGWESAQIFSPCENDFYELKKAAYRAILDTRSAVNFFVDKAESFQVDTDHIILFGLDAGAVASLHGAFLENGVFDAEIAGELGPLPDLTTEVDAVVSIAGFSFGLEGYLDNSNIPLLLYHGSCDTLVGYTYQRPFQCNAESGYDQVYGARCIADYGFTHDLPFFLKTYVGEGHSIGALNSEVLGDLINTAVEFINFDVFCGLQRQEDRLLVVGPDCSYPNCDGVSAVPDLTLDLQGIIVYPNPFSDGFTILLPDAHSGYRIIVRDTKGLILLKQDVSHEESLRLDLGSQADGIYWLQLTEISTGRSGLQKLIKSSSN